LNAVAAAAAGFVLVAPSGVGAARLPYSRTLLVVGDSLTVGTRPYLPAFLRGWRIRQEVSISKQASEGPSTLRRYGRRLSRVIFVNLGTNGDPRAVGPFVSAIRGVMRIAGPRRCVVWSTIVRPPVGGASYRAINAALAREGTRRRNLILFRWTRLAGRHPYWFGPDHVHVTATAYRIRARAMARDIDRCREIAIHRPS
jgi:lysophospholipase L1-like esterase